jgi:integrase
MAKIVKGEERGRPGKWIVDFRDGGGRRRWITCDTQEEANKTLGRVLSESGRHAVCAYSPNIRLDEYCAEFLKEKKQWLKPSSIDTYQRKVYVHIAPKLGRFRVRDISPAKIVAFLGELKASGRVDNGVLLIYAVLRSVLTKAVRDGIIVRNPASSLGRELKLSKKGRQRQDQIKAFTKEQRSRFLNTCLEHAPDWYPLFQFIASTGVRIGEACGIHLDEVDLETQKAKVTGTIYEGIKTSTKTGIVREVDLSGRCIEMLRRHIIKLKERALATGTKAEILFPSRHSAKEYLTTEAARDVFHRICKKAGLGEHFTPHCLRHTYATLLLIEGVSPQYVQQQLGHTTISMTMDTYGKWMPQPGRGAVDKLDATEGAL